MRQPLYIFGFEDSYVLESNRAEVFFESNPNLAARQSGPGRVPASRQSGPGRVPAQRDSCQISYFAKISLGVLRRSVSAGSAPKKTDDA